MLSPELSELSYRSRAEEEGFMADEWKDVLVLHLGHVREWTLLACGGLTEDRLLSIPDGARNHILWELGHICWTQDTMVTWGCAGGERLPDPWDEKFGYGSKVSTRAGDYPPLDEIRSRLETGREAIEVYIRSLTLDDLRSSPPHLSKKTAPDRLHALIHFLSHEAFHAGKISLLRTMLGLPSVAELYLES